MGDRSVTILSNTPLYSIYKGEGEINYTHTDSKGLGIKGATILSIMKTREVTRLISEFYVGA